MEINTYFERLIRPFDEGTDAFHALALPGDTGSRIAIDQQGRPAMLIRDIPIIPLSNFRLKYLEVSVRRGCRVRLASEERTEDFVLILFRAVDPTLTQYFFSIIRTFLLTLESARSDAQQEQAYHSLLEIFRSLNDEPLSTIQGLWSELFVINESQNTTALVNAWHHTPGARFDFTSGSERLEVKSSKIQARIHTFAAFQLIPDAGVNITIASLFAIESSSGLSLQQLVDQINDKLAEPELCLKLERIVARTLGRGIAQAMKVQFDTQVARNSLSFYDSVDVPRIEAVNIPARVSDVHFKADLSRTKPINPNKLYPESDLFNFI